MHTHTASVITLGCKVNQCDGAEIAAALAARGHRLVGRGRRADTYVVNTCTVTATADAKARKLIRRLARRSPGSQIIVTGCLAQRDPASLAALSGVTAVVPNSQKANLVDLISPPGDPAATGQLASPGSRIRAFLKVQDGCDHRCAYCAVPSARGQPISKPLSQAAAEVERLASAGAPEVVLCGIRLGAYGRDRQGETLAGLLRRLRSVSSLRLRLSSLEPMDITDELIAEMADHPTLCRHVHLPLQSGDDSVLAAMNRTYTAADFRRLTAALRSIWPEVALSTDVIAGFPGETDEQFARTCAFVREVGFSRLHVFPYSPRPGTPAANRPPVPPHVKRERVQRLLDIAGELARQAAAGWIGRPVEVLLERQTGNGFLAGWTEHYLPIRCRGPREWIGRRVSLRPDSATGAQLLCEAQGAADVA
jgi:threonylcarbamoyladenosine tRNA methylthiotransferase MtaB